MTSSFFDQRMLKTANEMYYFQLVPKLLTVKDPVLAKNLKVTNTLFRLMIMKGN